MPANSDVMSEMLQSKINNNFNAIVNDHKLMRVGNKRKQCKWIQLNGKRCTNNSYSACNSCTLNNQYYILCGGHFEEHKRLEAGVTLQGNKYIDM